MASMLAKIKKVGPVVSKARPARITWKMRGKVMYIPKITKHKHFMPQFSVRTGWTKDSQRVGALAVKLGMTSDWNEWGVRYPLTILQVLNCQVVQVKSPKDAGNEKKNLWSLQVGAGYKSVKTLSKALAGHFAKADIPPKRILAEFPVTPDAIIPPGTPILAKHFLPGQRITVTGVSKGKGFQGPMKRWGFGGLPASHGTSLTHRSHGATGNRQDPGKVFKGKKMAGRMGNEQTTIKNLLVFEVQPEHNLIYVVGAVPGAPGTWLKVKDSLGNVFRTVPPFPTYIHKPIGQSERLRAIFPNPYKADIETIKAEDPDTGKKVKKVKANRLWDEDELKAWAIHNRSSKKKANEEYMKKVYTKLKRPNTLMESSLKKANEVAARELHEKQRIAKAEHKAANKAAREQQEHEEQSK